MEEDGTMKSRDEKVPAAYRLAPPQTTSIPHELLPLLPANWPTEIPLARITTCGSQVSLEVLYRIQSGSDGPPTLVYGPPDAALLAEKSVPTALILLSILASQPGCAASIDWLSETLRHPHQRDEEDDDDREERPGLKRVDNIVTLLRHLLFPPILRDLPTARQLRRRLVASYRASGESGPGYRLAGMPLVWIDVEAIAEQIKQARSLDQFGHDGLPAWQAAYALAEHGVFLEREPYSDWASWRRQQVETQKWECVQALWQRLADQGAAGETEAIRILQSYWQSHMTTEDSFRPLIELLGKRECYGQAEEYYAHLYLALEQEGRQPDHRTQEAMVFVRALRIQRKPHQYQAISQGREPLPILDKNDTKGDINASQIEHESINSVQAVDGTHDSLIQLYGRNKEYISQREPWDWTTWFGLQLVQILCIVRLWSKQTEDFTGEIQTLVDQEIKAMDEALEQFHVQHEQGISRRQALVTIAALPTMFASRLVTDVAVEEFLSQVAASIIACWHLLRGNGLTSVREIIPKFAPALRTLALRPSRYQQSAARLATQTTILQAILAMHQLNVVAREAHCNDAIRYSDITKDPRLQAATRMYLGYTLSFCYWPRKPEKALPIFQQALHILGEEESLIRSDILMGMAEAFAQCKEEQQALHHIELAKKHFPDHPEHDQSFLYAECGLTTLYQWEGKMFLELSEHYPDRGYQLQARDVLMQSIGAQSLSDRCTTETIIYQADSARVTGELTIYANALRTAAQMALDIGSKKRYSEALIVYQRTPRRWGNEPQVQALARDLFKQNDWRKIDD